eukprot:g77798.t1
MDCPRTRTRPMGWLNSGSMTDLGSLGICILRQAPSLIDESEGDSVWELAELSKAASAAPADCRPAQNSTKGVEVTLGLSRQSPRTQPPAPLKGLNKLKRLTRLSRLWGSEKGTNPNHIRQRKSVFAPQREPENHRQDHVEGIRKSPRNPQKLRCLRLESYLSFRRATSAGKSNQLHAVAPTVGFKFFKADWLDWPGIFHIVTGLRTLLSGELSSCISFASDVVQMRHFVLRVKETKPVHDITHPSANKRERNMLFLFPETITSIEQVANRTKLKRATPRHSFYSGGNSEGCWDDKHEEAPASVAVRLLRLEYIQPSLTALERLVFSDALEGLSCTEGLGGSLKAFPKHLFCT